jgi:hypothetical protein
MSVTRPKIIHVEAHSSARVDRLFELLCDCSTWPAWSPIGSATLESPGEHGTLGEIRRFETGRTVSREQVVEVVPNRRLSYVLLSGLPLRDYRADVDLHEVPGGTRVSWHSSFRPGRPGSGWLYRLILRRFLRQMVEGLAAAGEQ